MKYDPIFNHSNDLAVLTLLVIAAIVLTFITMEEGKNKPNRTSLESRIKKLEAFEQQVRGFLVLPPL